MPTLEGKRLLGALDAFMQTPEGGRSPEVREAAKTLSQSLRTPSSEDGLTPGQKAVAQVTNDAPSRDVVNPLDVSSDELTPGDKAILKASNEIV